MTLADLIPIARDLRGDEVTDNPEYDRALVELVTAAAMCDPAAAALAEIRAAREGFTLEWERDRDSLDLVRHTATLRDAGYTIGQRVLDRKPGAEKQRVIAAELAADAFDTYDYPETETETPTPTGNYETNHIDRVTKAEAAALVAGHEPSDPLYRLQLSAFHADAKTHYLNVTHEQVQAIRTILASGAGV